MGADVSQVRQFANHVRAAQGRVGARAAAAVRITTLSIERDARILAPVDTGNLRNSITSEFDGDGRFGAATGTTGPTASYGGYVENGTSRMAPQPYLGPAFDRHTPVFYNAMDQIAGNLL